MRTVSRGPKMIAALTSLCVVSACAVLELRGPTVMALPKPGTSQAVFEQEHLQCRNYAIRLSPYKAMAPAAAKIAAHGGGERGGVFRCDRKLRPTARP
jgi:hypothetical protein